MIYITGDCHPDFRQFSTRVFPEQKEMSKDDFVIICGDFGGVWNSGGESKEEKHVLDWLDSKILQLENEIALLEPMHNDLTNIANLHLLVKVRSMEKYTHKNQAEIADEIMEGIERLAMSIHTLTNGLAETINLRNEDPFNYESFQEFRKNYEKAVTIDECCQWSDSVCEKLRTITDKVSFLLKEKKDTLEIIRKNVF